MKVMKNFYERIKYIILILIVIASTKASVVYGGFNGAAGSIGGSSPCAAGIYCWTQAYTGGDLFIGLRVSVVNSAGTTLGIKNYVVSKNSEQRANDNAWAINVMARDGAYTLFYGTQNLLGYPYMTSAKISGELFHSSLLFGNVPGSNNFFGGGGDDFINWLRSGTYSSGGTNLENMIFGTGYPCLNNPDSNPGLCSDMANHYALVEPMALFVIDGKFWLFTAYEAANYLYDTRVSNSGGSYGVGAGTYFKKLFNLFHLESDVPGLIRGEGGSGVNCGEWIECRNTIATGTSPRRGFGVVAYNVSALSSYTCEQVLGIIDGEYHSGTWYDYRDVTNRLYNAIRSGTPFIDNGVNYGIVTSSCAGNNCRGLLVTEPGDWTTSCSTSQNIPVHSTGTLACNDSDQTIATNYRFPSIGIGSIHYTCFEDLKTRFKGDSITIVPGHVLPLHLSGTEDLFAESGAAVTCSYSARVKMGSRSEDRIWESYDLIPSKTTYLLNHVFDRNKMEATINRDPYAMALPSATYQINNNSYTSGSVSRSSSVTDCETYTTMFSSVTYCTIKITFNVNETIQLKYDAGDKWSFENGVFGNPVTTSSDYTKESIYGIPIKLNTTTGIHNVKINHRFGNVFSGMIETNCPYKVEDYTCGSSGCGSDNEEEQTAKTKASYDYENMKLTFRTIDTENPFISINGNVRNTSTNWCYNNIANKETGIIVKGNCAYNNPTVNNNISSRNNSYNKYNQEPVYTITLMPEDISLIKSTYDVYRARNGYNHDYNYSDYEMYCDSNGERCISKFLNELNNITGNTTLTGRCGRSRLPGGWNQQTYDCI